MKKKTKKYLINISLALLSILLVILVIEMIIDPLFSELVPDDSILIERENDFDFSVRYANDLESDSTLRILNLGDSVTQNECPETEALETLLNNISLKYQDRRIDRVDIMNAGNGGKNAGDTKRILEEILDREIPIDIITVLSGWNEHWYNFFPCERICNFSNTMWQIEENVKKIPFCDTCREKADNIIFNQREKIWHDCAERIKEADKKVLLERINSYNTSIYKLSLEEYRNTLHDIINISRSNGIEVVLAVPPNSIIKGEVPFVSLMGCKLIDKDAYKDIHLLYTTMIRQVGREADVPVINLEKIFDDHPDKEILFGDPSHDPIHPNEDGNKVCTEEFYDFFREYLSVE